ncbi:DNA recombination protein RmuC [Aestuariibacter halophilus]|uniref:DNA recombination protein RmuC n=1 Tax=Fluctibacter halophilus TaxID=226011 RepID=A0ABS8G8A9_9ALTE|nr:DNA recombination protein RmuC [Aestuariibacter halophilus]MCC2615466.1 DNA recombination protein RmuC [Aestuariibacter halophilus]
MNLQLDLVLLLACVISAVVGAIAMKVLSAAAQKRRLQEAAAQQESLAQKLAQTEHELGSADEKIDQLQQQINVAQGELGEARQLRQQLQDVQQEKQQWQSQWKQASEEISELKSALEKQRASAVEQQKAADEKIQLLQDAEQRLQQQFENLANKIFEQKQEKFTQSSKAGLDALLNPLKEQIEGFKKQVTDQYVSEGKERASLKTEILGLKELNQRITEEAAALTKALKGDNKQQGNWGEVVLERILKESGLREGHEFELQVSLKNDQGKTYQPDVVVHLPNDKDIVIDSKVSLAAYERYFNAGDDDALRQACLTEHVASLKSHIKELGKKDYQDLQGIRTLDYVLMFVPVEPAFLLAVDQAPELVKLALDNNIMLVSPTNLLVALRTINNIWQYEYQNQNAQKIALSAGKLYDKFHGFVGDMEKIGRSLDTVQKAYDASMNKLTSGKGNLVRQVEQFRAMGVQTNKRLDSHLLEKAGLDEGLEDGPPTAPSDE